MSKLAIVLYAAAIIVSASAGKTSRNRNNQAALLEAAKKAIKVIVYPVELAAINRQTVNRHINESIEKIIERSADLYRRVIQLGPQTGEENMSVTVPYSLKVSTHLETLESFINHYVAVSRGGPVDPTTCLGNYTVYNKAVKAHMQQLLKQVCYEVYNEATMKIGKLLHTTNEEISRISNLSVRAKTCNEFECNDISKAAKDIEAAYYLQTHEGLQDYMNMVDRTAIIKKLDASWNYWVDMGLDVMQSIYDCIFRTIKS